MSKFQHNCDLGRLERERGGGRGGCAQLYNAMSSNCEISHNITMPGGHVQDEGFTLKRVVDPIQLSPLVKGHIATLLL